MANPEGANVAAGQVEFDAQGKKLNIHQTSQKAIIDWRQFNIAADEHTQFYQPNSAAIALNRVAHGNPSRIDGRLTANGRVILVNPDGVFFGAGSSVDVAGLVATSANIRNHNFLSGQMNFDMAGNPDAMIINEGTISAKEAGLVGFIAPQVENHGSISARLGTVALAAGETFTMDMAGDGIVSVAVDKDQLARQIAANTGRISADGGTVHLQAAAARAHVNSLVSNTGVIEAKTVATKNGKIILSAQGSSGTGKTGFSRVVNAGKADASGQGSGHKGGSVDIAADKVTLKSGSDIRASGAAGGGKVRIGGDYQGGGDMARSAETVVEENTSIDVSATEDGDGGTAVVWSDINTIFKGAASARGGAVGGDGGLIEVSGKKYLDFSGSADTQAVMGETGILLLDPTDIVISAAANTNVNGASPFSPTADDVTSILNVTTLQTALAANNVVVQTRATGSQQGNITVSSPISWSANRTLTLDAHNNITVDAAITARNSLIFNAGGDVILNANLNEHTSGATLVFQPKILSNTIGVAGGAGILNLSTADLAFIQPNWNSITIGAATGTGNINLNGYTWNAPLSVINSGAGVINVDGAQNVGSRSMTITTRNLNLNANVVGGTSGTLTIQQDANAVTMGIGDGQTGTLNLTNAELARISDGWGAIALGRTSATAAVNVGAYTWLDPLSLRSSTGVLNVNGTQTMGANALTVSTRNLNLAGDLIGTGTLIIQTDAASATMGVGDAQTGTLQVSNAELARIINGWGSINFGRTDATGALNLGAYTWQDSLGLRSASGAVNINGTQTLGANNLTAISSNLNIAGDLVGTGNLVIQSHTAATTTGIGDGQTGTLNLTNAELARIVNGWNSITFGRTDATGAMNIGAANWNDSVAFASRTGVINVNGNQNVGSNNLTFTTRAINLVGSSTGTGNLTIQPEGNTTMGIGNGATGTLLLSDAALAKINDGWNAQIFGSAASTAALEVATHNWSDSVIFRTLSGLLTISGNQNVGNNNLTLQTDSNVAINGNLAGSGALTIAQTSAATSIGVAGGAGTLNVSAVELGRLTDGWGSINFGNSAVTATGAININGYNFNDNVGIYTDTGVVTFGGVVDIAGNDLTITSRAAVNIGAALNGTGKLNIIPEANNTTVGLAGGAGSLAISAASLANIGSGWDEIFIGRSDNSGAMAINGYSAWLSPVTFKTGSGAITVAGAQNFGANDVAFETSGNMVVNSTLTGTGNLSIRPSVANTTIGLAGGAGTLNFTTAELNNIANGWNSINIGRLDGTGAIAVNAHNWNDNLTLRSGSGVITVAGAQNLGANNLTIQTGSNLSINAALSGSGNLAIQGATDATTIGLAGGTGMLALTALELNNITNGWQNIFFGSETMTGALTLNAYSAWNDSVTLRTNTGSISVAGAQNFGANNLTILTNTDPSIGAALAGTGTLSFRPLGLNTTMSLAGGSGAYKLTTAEIGQISNGWSQIIVGRDDLTANIDIHASTWNDPLRVVTAGNILLHGNLTSTESSGTSLVLASLSGNFINNAGAAAINPGGGRYLVYSQSPLLNTLGGLGGFGKKYNITYASYAPESVIETGNRFFYALAPTLTVTANNASREYGLSNSLSATISGFIDGDTEVSAMTGSADLTTAADQTSDVGSYSVVAGIGSLASALGYQFTTFFNGVLDVTPATLTVTANDKTREYGLGNPTFDATITGYRNADNQSVISGLGFSSPATSASDVGAYAINASGATATNYVFNYVDGALQITPATLTVTANDKTREYGLANPALDGLVTGFRNGDTISAVTDLAYNTAATIMSDAGFYTISASGASATNYIFNYVDGQMSITKAPLTVSADNKAKQQGEVNPLFTATISGLRNGDSVGVLSGLDFATTATTASVAGDYIISPFGITAQNYDVVSYVDGNLQIDALSVSNSSLPSSVEATNKPHYANIVQGSLFSIENSSDEVETASVSEQENAAVLSEDETSEEQESVVEAQLTPQKGFTVQAGAFGTKEGAAKFAEKIKGLAQVKITAPNKLNGLWKVTLGPFTAQSQADAVLDKLHKGVSPSAWVLAEPN